MSSTQFRVRRATLDDIGQLTALWNIMAFPAEDLARRITEFQLAETMDGKLIGAVALQITQRQGRVHSEAFNDFAHAEQVRPLLWERLQAVATNHGLLRLWTQEQAPFWAHSGLTHPDPETLANMPAVWRGLPGKWLTLKLKEDLEEVISADKEFALFMESEKQRSQRALRQAKVLKFIATLLAFGVLIVVLIGAFLLFRRNPQFIPH
jgi:N-acetylglutamate synthase-like GNAT family acetyltransferase